MTNVELQETLRFLKSSNVQLRQENDMLRQEVSHLGQVLEILLTLHDFSYSVTERTDVVDLLDRILASALAAIDAADGSLMLVDEETAELAFVVVHGAIREPLAGHRIPLGEGVAGWVAQHAEPVHVPNVQRDPRFSPEVDREFDFYTRSILCVPLIYGERVMGVIQALNKEGGSQFTETELSLLGIVAQLAAAAMYRAEAAVVEEKE